MPQGYRPRPAKPSQAKPSQAKPAPAKPEPVSASAGSAAAVAAPRSGRAPRAPFVLLVVGLLCGGLVSLLLLNTVLARDSFERENLLRENGQLRVQKEDLKHGNMQLEMPDALADKAVKQGENPDWNRLDVLIPGHPNGQTASDGQRLAGQEPVPGTGQ
jgi:hypothetical protein